MTFDSRVKIYALIPLYCTQEKKHCVNWPMGSFKKYLTDKIAILIPNPPPHVTACHVPVDTTSLLSKILVRHTTPHYMGHIDQPLFDIAKQKQQLNII